MFFSNRLKHTFQNIGKCLNQMRLIYLYALFLFLSGIHFQLNATHNLSYTLTQDGITLNAHIMTRQESLQTFLHDLHTYQICPLELVITNNTSTTFMISGNSIEELLLVPPSTITHGIIYKNQMVATITAYASALTAGFAFLSGFNAIEQSLPTFVSAAKNLSSAAALVAFLYQAHQFATRLSNEYTLTHKNIMRYGLSNSNIIIDQHSSLTVVMFLNNKSYPHPLAAEDNFYYIFTIKLYNLYASSDTITIPVELPKIYFFNS